MALGPVEYIIVGFPGNNFRGQIAPELAKLIDSGDRAGLGPRVHRKG